MTLRTFFALALALSCGCFAKVGPHGIDVGAACRVSDATPPCDEGCSSVSTTDDSGFCTFRCRNDSDCPSGTACIDVAYSDNEDLLHSTTSPYFVCAQKCDKDATVCIGYAQAGFTCTPRAGVAGGTIDVCFLPE